MLYLLSYGFISLMFICLFFFFFFFSSRRRHTRYIGDWSSDVCSSDLVVIVHFPVIPAPQPRGGFEAHKRDRIVQAFFERSEERRVGKECRSRWTPEQ